MAKSILQMKDIKLLEFAKSSKNALLADAASYDFSPEEIAEIIGAVDEYGESYTGYQNVRTQARSLRLRKDGAKKKLKMVLGNYISRLRAKRDLPSEKLVKFGVKPKDTTRTPVNPPDSAPMFDISYAPLSHIIRFWEDGSARHRRKPNGVFGAEIYINLGGELEDHTTYKYLEIAFKSPHTIKFEPEDIGKTAHYYLIWLTKRGERSPRTGVLSATVGI